MNSPTEEKNVSNAVWQSQALESPRISLQYVRHQAEKLNSDVRRELRLAYIGTISSALALGLFVFPSASLRAVLHIPTSLVLVIQVTVLLLLLASGYLTHQVRRRLKMLLTREHEQVMESLEAYRTELQRRRNYYLGAWRWSFWPLVPAIGVILVGGMIYDERPGKWLRLTLAALVCVLGSLLGAWIYARRGNDLQRELDALTTLDKK
jgi:hypothetical protein